jgi:hypothetical protein
MAKIGQVIDGIGIKFQAQFHRLENSTMALAIAARVTDGHHPCGFGCFIG